MTRAVPEPARTATVAAEGVAKTYRRGPERVHALAGVHVAVAPGELVALVGPSGSGKTTLLNVLAGWERPDEGAVAWQGRRGPALPDDARRWDRVAIVPQTLGLVDELTIEENVVLPLTLGLGGPETRASADELLTRMDLDAVRDRLPGDVSLGERQRAAVIRALLCDPALLLADEPTAHQDAEMGAVLLGTVRQACARGMACLVATHNPELLAVVDRVVRLRDGEVVPAG